MYGCRGARNSDLAGRLLDQLAGVHDRDRVGDLDEQRQVVGDEQDAEAEPLAQVHQLFEDLALDHHVERGGRLVHDEQARPQGDRDRDHHPLAHAAGELVRIAGQPVGADADDVEQLLGAGPPLGLGRMCFSCVLSTSSSSWPMRSTGLSACSALWNTTAISDQRTAADDVLVVGEQVDFGRRPGGTGDALAALAVGTLGVVVEVGLAGGDDARVAQQPRDGVGQRRLAAAALAGEADAPRRGGSPGRRRRRRAPARRRDRSRR